MPWMGPQKPRGWGGGGGGWQPDYSQFAGPGGGGPGLRSPAESRMWARMGIHPGRMQAKQRALQDFHSGAALRAQLARGFSRMGAEQLF